MRINTNVSAMNAANNLTRVQNAVSSSMEKLSSGFRINHAADDAAGLGIANKLRADGRALTQASRNAEQTNSLLQVAEGGTQTIQSILERMKELATQSGSDTVDSAGRQSINAEFVALRNEITRTVSTTQFEGSGLLDGTFGTTAAQLNVADIVPAAQGTAAVGTYTIQISGNVVTVKKPDTTTLGTVDVSTLTGSDYSNGKVALKFGTGATALTLNVTADNANDIVSVNAALSGKTFTIGSGAAATHTGAMAANVPGVTIGTIAAGVADGNYDITATDRTQALVGGPAGASIASVASSTVAGTYDLVVNDASAVSNVNASNIKSLAVTGGAPAGNYVMKVTGASGSEVVDLYAASDTSFSTSLGQADIHTFSTGSDLAVSFSGNSGVSFTIDGGLADQAAVKAQLEGKTVDVTASSVDVKLAGVTKASVSLSTGYTNASNFHFVDGASKFDFTIDTSAGTNSANTYSKFKNALQGMTIKVTDAHIDVKQGGTLKATQSYTPGQIAVGSAITFNNSGANDINFTISGSLNTGFNTWKSAVQSQQLVVSSTLAGANSATAVQGNSSAHVANFMIDSSGQYKTSDLVQLNAFDLTVGTLGLGSSDLLTATTARAALSTIDSALGTVSSALGQIGANQNRIGYAQDNLKTKIANFSAAESVIRDVDMADEMTKFSKNNILAQAGTAMLAQANQAGQSVLRLLQG